MNGKYYDSYPKNGRTQWIYEVECTPEEKKQIQKIKGKGTKEDYYRESEKGNPLLWVRDYSGENVQVSITINDKVVVKDVEFEKLKSYTEKSGGNLGQSMADQAAQHLFGNLMKRNVFAPASTAPEGAPAQVETKVDTKTLDEG